MFWNQFWPKILEFYEICQNSENFSKTFEKNRVFPWYPIPLYFRVLLNVYVKTGPKVYLLSHNVKFFKKGAFAANILGVLRSKFYPTNPNYWGEKKIWSGVLHLKTRYEKFSFKSVLKFVDHPPPFRWGAGKFSKSSFYAILATTVFYQFWQN